MVNKKAKNNLWPLQTFYGETKNYYISFSTVIEDDIIYLFFPNGKKTTIKIDASEIGDLKMPIETGNIPKLLQRGNKTMKEKKAPMKKTGGGKGKGKKC